MSDVEREELPSESDAAKELDSQWRANSARLSSLPIEALLYYVLYGDQALSRLT